MAKEPGVSATSHIIAQSDQRSLLYKNLGTKASFILGKLMKREYLSI
jgi:hypothetical protein